LQAAAHAPMHRSTRVLDAALTTHGQSTT